MRKILLFLLLLPVIALGNDSLTGQFGVGDTYNFKLLDTDGSLDEDEADSGTEVTVDCDGAGFSAATNDFVNESSGSYSIALTAAEMKCGVVGVAITPTSLDEVFHIYTYGDYRAHNKTVGMASGVAQSGTSTTIVLESGTTIGDDILNNSVIMITGGTGVGQRRLIDDWTSASDTATVSTWDTTPDSTSEYIVLPQNQASVATLSAQVVADWAAQICAGTPTANSFEDKMCDVMDAIADDTSNTLDARQQTILTNSQRTFLYSAAIDVVTSQTEFDVDEADDPGINNLHIDRYLCVIDNGSPDVNDCERITGYSAATNRWTIAAALDFTVDVGDTIFIPSPSNTVLGTGEITAAVIATDAIGDAELASDAFDGFPLVATNTTIAALSTQESFTLSAGSADNDAYNGCGIMITDSSTATQKAYAGIQDYEGATRGVTLDADPSVFTMQAGDFAAVVCMPTTAEFMNKSEILGVGNSGDKWRGNP